MSARDTTQRALVNLKLSDFIASEDLLKVFKPIINEVKDNG